MQPFRFSLIAILVLVLGACARVESPNTSTRILAQAEVADQRPNILLVMADDMGWTDLGSFGSEIETPNLDRLARRGVMFTNFHTSMSCSPTRSMLLSGTDNHHRGPRQHGRAFDLHPSSEGSRVTKVT